MSRIFLFFLVKRGSFEVESHAWNLYLARDSGVNHVQDAKFHISTLQRITGLVAGKHALFFLVTCPNVFIVHMGGWVDHISA